MSEISELLAVLWFLGVMAALGVLFVAGLKLPVPPGGRRRWLARAAIVLGAAALTVLANIALFRHDAHLDLTREKAFSPSPEAQKVVKGLAHDVELVYFYQKQNPAGRAAKTMVEIMGRINPRLTVRTVDLDQHPGLANRYGVRLYNAAVLLSGDRRIEVVTTDDRDIALGILRVTRSAQKVICFAVGHGEYDIDNVEYHTHFEGFHAHSHDVQGLGVVLTEQHGLGRLRRALDKLGLASTKVTLATAGRVPADCAALVEANPRTPYSPPEIGALQEYLDHGGAALLLYDLDYPVEPRLAALLARSGIRLGEGVVVDPLDHYFTDEQMIAVTRYGKHVATQGLALSFFPGVRPVEVVPALRVTTTPLFSSSTESYVRPVRGASTARVEGPRRAHALAVAVEGRGPDSPGSKPFRLIVVGDGDFASNSFFPYMSNADLVLAMLAWLIGEERAPTMKPPVEVLPTVTLTNQQVRGIFLITVIVLPGLVAVIGGAVWWQRRR
ncbi:MAG TPA: GldG family protein [Methylomirabilota bacterium]|nr:GldG family protein [Methylomirabilota bacterium]